MILSHIKRTSGEEASHRLAGLWVCGPDNNNANICEAAITARPPEHPLVKVQKYTKFVRQSSCIFSHTISCNKRTQRPPKYIQCVDVWFKRLQYSLEETSPLPRLWDYVYALFF
jgi:hypothetical protein